jgi:hypothetical protein
MVNLLTPSLCCWALLQEHQDVVGEMDKELKGYLDYPGVALDVAKYNQVSGIFEIVPC